MISALSIKGFKRFASLDLEMRPLTVLAGLNGAGKTSTIHSILLAREASRGGSSGTVALNGPFGLELGVADDVRNRSTDADIEFELVHDGGAAVFAFGVPEEESLYLTIEAPPTALPLALTHEPRVFTYLCAERLGPRSVLGASALPVESLEVGVRGEFCAQVLAATGDRPIHDEGRHHPNASPEAARLLKYEVEKWLGEIVRPVELDVESFPGTSVTALRFRTPGGDWVRAPNMGFGVSYALPIVLGGLVAANGGLLMVENPEAHLHPAGQSRMGVFLAWLAARGVQVLVETHSDHVLNGIRRAIGELRYLEHSKACVHFFDSDDDQPRVATLAFSVSGGVTDWPAGFFDQYQIDVAALGRVRRQR